LIHSSKLSDTKEKKTAETKKQSAQQLPIQKSGKEGQTQTELIQTILNKEQPSTVIS
jgi:hypothetical protein